MRYLQGEPHSLPRNRNTLADYRAEHFVYEAAQGVATITLDRPERKNPLTFDSYAELRDLFRALAYAEDVKAVVIAGAGGNFCSGGDVHEIIGPLTMASDLRLATPRTRTAFLFARVGLAGCDMGACSILPRIIGQGRAAELLYTGRSMSAEEGERWGFYNRLCEPDAVLPEARQLARGLADGPSFAHGMTKKMLQQEWNMGIDEAIEAEAQAQAICMATNDFHRAYHAFVAKQAPLFEGD
jgi:enoyl-CoA hydratase/carnithine racemase